ncbi:MAG TPA: ATP-binding protein [Kofleriaceae bacterium]|nr:ATP-binding protein [Kofleriaceae bacterium]
MDSPYRSAPRTDDVEAPRDTGIVGEVVAQFADPLAFYRELVQNAIDAGSPAIEVEVSYDAAAGAVRAVVRDRGEGMDRDTVENQLLVLFRSTKDRDPTKIGKFGIGFSSVLAPRPRVVVVQTVRGGQRLTLHLHPDLSYQLFDGGKATRNGTSVELELPMEPAAVADFARRSREALTRWCRHAAVPIEFSARGANSEALDDVRIDTPLALGDALVEVRGVSSDGATTAVVGLRAGAATYGGFFNRGLMLREFSEPLAGRVAFKVIDARLGHTLSRDDVRRDAAFDKAMALVGELTSGALTRAAAAALREAAERDHARWAQLFAAIDLANLALDGDDWKVPLAAPIGDVRAAAPPELPRKRVWAADRCTPLIEALADAGVAVIAPSSGGLDAGVVVARFERQFERRLIEVEDELTLVTAVPPTVADHGLIDALGHLLGETTRKPNEIVLVELMGAAAEETFAAGGREHAMATLDAHRWVIDRDIAGKNPMALLWRPALLLNTAAPLVVAARKRAEEDPALAASHLARALLLKHRALDAEASTTLLQATLSRLGARW